MFRKRHPTTPVRLGFLKWCEELQSCEDAQKQVEVDLEKTVKQWDHANSRLTRRDHSSDLIFWSGGRKVWSRAFLLAFDYFDSQHVPQKKNGSCFFRVYWYWLILIGLHWFIDRYRYRYWMILIFVDIWWAIWWAIKDLSWEFFTISK